MKPEPFGGRITSSGKSFRAAEEANVLPLQEQIRAASEAASNARLRQRQAEQILEEIQNVRSRIVTRPRRRRGEMAQAAC
jgi:hypothetical protein